MCNKTLIETIDYLVEKSYDKYMNGSNNYYPTFEEFCMLVFVYDQDRNELEDIIYSRIDDRIKNKGN